MSASTAALRLAAIAKVLRVCGLRPIIDAELQAVYCDCAGCGAQDVDPLGLWRPVTIVPRNGRVRVYCAACGRGRDA